MYRNFSNNSYSNFPRRRSGFFGIFKFLFIIGVLIIIVGFIFKTTFKVNTEVVYNCKVIKLQQLNILQAIKKQMMQPHLLLCNLKNSPQ